MFRSNRCLRAKHIAIMGVLILLSGVSGQDNYLRGSLYPEVNEVGNNRGTKFYGWNGSFVNYQLEPVMEFGTRWKFQIGDDQKWARLNFDDAKWESMPVPGAWEDNGYPGYDGYAWYRYNFELPTGDVDYDRQQIYLYMGYIDDVDEVYINGICIGTTGGFPPKVNRLDYILRRYAIPPGVLNPGGKNVIAVRIYDDYLLGGITRGVLGLYTLKDEFFPDLDLRGDWYFRPGDDARWMEPDLDYSNWSRVLVPASWESQGFNGLDGMAWYRKTFQLPAKLRDEDLVLMLGLIDDLDEVYVNGEVIGSHGIYNNGLHDTGFFWVTHRNYLIPRELLKQENTIAVRVYDDHLQGGIYDGPVGLVSLERFKERISKMTRKKAPVRSGKRIFSPEHYH